jgi:hypothetical protein
MTLKQKLFIRMMNQYRLDKSVLSKKQIEKCETVIKELESFNKIK